MGTLRLDAVLGELGCSRRQASVVMTKIAAGCILRLRVFDVTDITRKSPENHKSHQLRTLLSLVAVALAP
jgi:hypothetical protein